MRFLKVAVLTLAILLTVSAFVMPVSAAPNNGGTTGYYGGILTYRISSRGTASITKCNGAASGAVEIPAEIDGVPVTSIADYAFQHCKSITSVYIPEGITGIGYSAFYGCTSLETVNIPSTVEKIEYAAFYKCSALKSADIADLAAWCNTSLDGEYATPAHILGTLTVNGQPVTSITVRDYVPKISDYAFYGCKTLTSVTLPEALEEIGECAFYGCDGLASISVPDGVSVIGEGAFSDCDGLKELNIAAGNQKYSNKDGNLIELDTKTLIRGVDSGIIPTDGSVVRLGSYAFSGCSMISASVPDCIVAIGASTYKDCKQLTTATVPSSVDVIRAGVFSGCEKLTSVTLPDTINLIGVSAFRDCTGLENIDLPASLGEIKDYAFANCVKLKSVTIPQAVKGIGGGVFDGCKSLSTIAVEKGNTRYGCDQNCLIDYKNGTLLRGTYKGTVPTDGSVKKIGYYAFSGCDNLTAVVIPDGVSEIGINAFLDCDNLKTVYCGSDEATFKKVKKLEGNDVLKSAEMLYNNTDIPVANGDSDGNGSNGGLLGGGDGDGTDNWLWLGMGAGAVLIIAVAIVLVLKSRKKRS